ncbi:MAG: hypothetical protein IH585_10075 [Anaerolineaceae bacterium]|nr:hypothetical protein [Anaerolineaceae bacterium]
MNAESRQLPVKTTLLMFVSMIFGFLFAWGSGVLLVYRFFTMRRDA